MIGAGLGGGIGFIIGTLIFPVGGIGSIVGASLGVMIGGLAGAKCGRKFSVYLFAKLEGKMYKLQVLAARKSYRMMLATERGDYLPKKHKRAGRVLEKSKSSIEKAKNAEHKAKLIKLT